MNNILRPTLELTVIIPGMILAYLPVKSTLKISLPKLIASDYHTKNRIPAKSFYG